MAGSPAKAAALRLLLVLTWAAVGKAAKGDGKPSRKDLILAAIESGASIADRPEYLSVVSASMIIGVGRLPRRALLGQPPTPNRRSPTPRCYLMHSL